MADEAVLNVDAFGREVSKVIPTGTYTASIVDFGLIKPSMNTSTIYFLPIELLLDQTELTIVPERKVFSHVTGYYNAINMIARNKDKYVGMIVKARIRIMIYNDVHYNDVAILWQE